MDIGGLCYDIQRARLTLRYPREQMVEMVRQYAGAHWSEETNVKAVPLNLIAAYVNIIGRKLIAGDPQVMISTDDEDGRPMVDAMMAWANKEVEKTKLGAVLERCAINALFSIGIAKVGIASPSDSALQSWELDAGDPFVMSIDLDDFVFDIHARTFDQVSFVGHRYRAPLSTIKGKRKDFVATEDRLFNLEGDERLSVLGRSFYSNQEEFEPMVDLWEIYLPRHKVVVTLLEDNLTGPASMGSDRNYGKPLRIQRWLGPDGGPYHMLTLGGIVPGNPMGKGPIQDLLDLHLNINAILRKLLRQAQRQKEILPVNGQQTDDGGRALETNDGEAFQCDNEAPRPVTFGGPSQANFQLMGALKDLFSWMAGNLDVQGGLSPEAKTLGQERLMSASSGATVQSMQKQMVDFVCSILQSLMWFHYHHPQKSMKVSTEIPHAPHLRFNRHVHPRGSQLPGHKRNMKWEDINVKVDPYSLPHATPEEKLQLLNQTVMQIIIPMGQLLQASGIVFEPHEYLDLVSKLGNMPELKKMLTIQEPPQDPQAAGGEPTAAPKSPETTRNYVRHSQGNASAFGKDLARGNAMKQPMNGQPQGAMP